MPVQKFSKTITVDAGGDGTATLPKLRGVLKSIEFVNTDLAATLDVTIKAGNQDLWVETDVAADSIKHPRVLSNIPSTGVASAITEVEIPLVGNDPITITLAQGGISKTGTFHFIVDAVQVIDI